jgi:hypothetical protein
LIPDLKNEKSPRFLSGFACDLLRIQSRTASAETSVSGLQQSIKTTKAQDFSWALFVTSSEFKRGRLALKPWFVICLNKKSPS